MFETCIWVTPYNWPAECQARYLQRKAWMREDRVCCLLFLQGHLPAVQASFVASFPSPGGCLSWKELQLRNHLKTETDWCRPHTTTSTRSKLWRTPSLVQADLLHLSMLRLEGVGRGSKGQPRGTLRAKVLNARSTSCTVSCLTRAHARGGIGSISFTLYARWSMIN